MARPRDLTADPISVLSTWPTLEPLPDMGLDLGLRGLRELPPQLLPQHRLSDFEEIQRGPEPRGDQLLFCSGHRMILPDLPQQLLHRRVELGVFAGQALADRADDFEVYRPRMHLDVVAAVVGDLDEWEAHLRAVEERHV